MGHIVDRTRMTQVFNPYSRFTAPLEAVEQTVNNDEIELPDAIDEINMSRVNGKLHIESTPEDDSFSRYTPTALIKAGLSEKNIVIEDDGTVTHETVSTYKQDLGWSAMDEDEELNTRTITYVDFYGRDDEILVHGALRAAMFHVLCDLTQVAVSGYVNGILLEDDELEPVWYEAGGESFDVELNVSKTSEGSDTEEESDGPVNWSQHS